MSKILSTYFVNALEVSPGVVAPELAPDRLTGDTSSLFMFELSSMTIGMVL